MISRKYGALRPQYLRGENIDRHCAIIEGQDDEIDRKLELIRDWALLERPILVERVASSNTEGSVTVHINTTHVIQKIVCTGDYVFSREFEESELVTGDEFSFTYSGSVMPSFTVRVVTFEGYEYLKSYPENDERMDNSSDHDEFLDIIGHLLGISRRIYKEYDFANDGARAYPPYFMKEDSEGVLRAGTEDDWYYYTRLKFFVENYGVMETSMLMNKLVYEQDIIDVYPSNTSHVDTGETYYYSYLIDSVSDYVNIDSVNQNRIASAWLPVTRPARFSTLTDTLLWVEGTYVDVPPNAFDIQYMLMTDDGNYYPVERAPICVRLQGVVGDGVTLMPVGERDPVTGLESLQLSGLNGGGVLELEYEGEHELNSSDVVEVPFTLSDEYSLSLEDWEYYEVRGKGTIIPPENSDVYDYEKHEHVFGISGGKNCVLYVPIYNPDLPTDLRIQITLNLLYTPDYRRSYTFFPDPTLNSLYYFAIREEGRHTIVIQPHIHSATLDGQPIPWPQDTYFAIIFSSTYSTDRSGFEIISMTVQPGLKTIINEHEGTFNLTKWTGTGGTNRSIDTDGVLLATNTNNYFNKYINGTEWEIWVELSVSDLTSSSNVLQLTYDNTTEGHTVIRYQNGTWTFRAYELVDGTQTQISSQDISAPFTSTDDKVLFIINRNGNKITFQYGIKTDGGAPYNYSRTYTNVISDNSRLRLVSHADAYWKVHSLKIRVGDDYTSDIYTTMLTTTNWQAYTTNWATATNKPTISGTQLTFNTTHNYLYTSYSLKDFLDETGRCRLVYKKGGGNGYANLTFANPTTGDEIGLKWASSSAPYYKWVNTAENYEIIHNYQICYLVWNEVIITKDGNNLVYTFHWQDGSNNSQTGYGVFTIPIGNVNLDDYYLNMYRSSGGTLYLNTDYSIIQHPARES